jgi:uncharacterized membrane protein
MTLLHAELPGALALLGWALLAPFALRALAAARRSFVPAGAPQHLWLAGVLALASLWHAQSAGGPAELHFGLLGVALFALVFGRTAGLLGLLAALLLLAALGRGRGANIGAAALLLAVLPAYLVTALQAQLERRLPANVFIFMIGNGLFVVLAVTAVVSLALLAAGAALGAGGGLIGFDTFTDRLAQRAGFALLLAWGEALASGMLFSALVIFAPRCVLTFARDKYLPRHGAAT